MNDQEILFLSTWLSENAHISNTWPAEIVLTRVRDVLDDGKITDQERAYLKSTLEELVGGSFADTGAAQNGPTSLPVDSVSDLSIQGSAFCFTGQFVYGTRSACERATASRGGTSLGVVSRKIDYLVIGTLASRDWKNSSHGSKIEDAVRLRNQGHRLKIVKESDWARALGGMRA